MGSLPINSSVFLIIWCDIPGSGSGSEKGIPGRDNNTSRGVEVGIVWFDEE